MQLRAIGRANLAALIFALGYFTYNLLYSPHYQVMRALRLAAEHGRVVALDSDPAFGGDFLSEWSAGYMIRAGDRRRLYDTTYADEVHHDPAVMGIPFDEDKHLYLFYPPAYYLLVTPFSLLPIQWAAVVWYCVMAACLIAALAILVRCVSAPPWLFGAALVLCIFFAPLTHSLNSGQKGTLWLLVFVGMFCLLRHERQYAAGLIFGLLVLKPPLTLAAGFVMLWKRQWRFLAGATTTVLIAVVLSLLVGTDVCQEYVRLFTRATNFTLDEAYPRHAEHGWYGFFALLTGGQSPGLVRGLAVGMDLVTLAVLLFLFRGPLHFTRERFTLQFSGLVLAAALVSLKFQTYDLAIMMLPILLLIRLYATAHTEFDVYRPHLLLTALVLFGGFVTAERLAALSSFQVSVWLMLAVLVFLERVSARVDELQPEVGSNVTQTTD